MIGEVLSPIWNAPRVVQAAFTTRLGGTSTGAYASFNLAAHVGDDPHCVAANRAQLKESLGLTEEPVWLEQVHGTNVAVLNDATPPARPPRADAAVTVRRGRACAILTADCLPVLLSAEDGSVVAAAHAGWRGLAAGVLDQTIVQMNTQPSRIVAWLGPGIGGTVYEVGDEVREALDPTGRECPRAFTRTRNGHWLANLALVARTRLRACGVSHVSGGKQCAYSDNRFYSYRRDHITGRMASLIWIAPEETGGPRR